MPQIMIQNTQSGKKEPFETIEPGVVKMYVCGITAYDLSHIGHARSQVVFDTIQRYLKYRAGFTLTYVRNYTDIDDKIINKGRDAGVPFNEISERFIAEFDRDMETLGIEQPTHAPKATEYIDGMIEMVTTLIAKGHAYEVNGDVYFDVASFKEYGKLSGKTLEDLQAGARVDVDERKKAPADFALWKKKRYGYEPSWPSPWGDGRPGWHLECSVMSSKLLGASFDIHGGGLDLIFPHHENEIAQSEAYSGKPFVRYWLHNGFVNINKEKMSKSLGNFLTIRDMTAKHHPEALKLFMLSHHYRSPMDFDYEKLGEAEVSLRRLYLSLRNWNVIAPDGTTPAANLPDELTAIETRFDDAMADDFNTAQALGAFHDYVRTVNRIMAEKKKPTDADRSLLAAAKSRIAGMTQVFGILQQQPDRFFDDELERHLSSIAMTRGDVDTLLSERVEARKNKDFARADAIRNELAAKGIELEDTPAGTTYRIKV